MGFRPWKVSVGAVAILILMGCSSEPTGLPNASLAEAPVPEPFWIAALADGESPLSLAFADARDVPPADMYHDFADRARQECGLDVGPVELADDGAYYLSAHTNQPFPGKAARLVAGFSAELRPREARPVPAIDQAVVVGNGCLQLARDRVYDVEARLLGALGTTLPQDWAFDDAFLDVLGMTGPEGYSGCMGAKGHPPDTIAPLQLLSDPIPPGREIAVAVDDWECRADQFATFRDTDYENQRTWLAFFAAEIEQAFTE